MAKRLQLLGPIHVEHDFGAENAGKLVYVGEDGLLTPLTVGDDLSIEDGVLHVVSSCNSGGDVDQSGLTAEQITALDEMFKICAYTTNAKNVYEAFQTAFGIDGSGGEVEPDEPNPPVTPDEPETGVSNETEWADSVAYTFDWVENEYVGNSSGAGKFTPYNGWNRSPYLYCDGVSELTIHNPFATSSGYNAFYDENHNYISSFNTAKNAVITQFNTIPVPEGAVYFVVSYDATQTSATGLSYTITPNASV